MTRLLEGLPVTGRLEPQVEVTGIQHDSRRVVPGDLFVAIDGERFDGRLFAPDAIDRGAVAVLAGGPPLEEVSVPWVEVPDPRATMGPMAARIFDHPDEELALVGVTGTNGKSTITWVAQRVLETAGLPTGRIGGLGYAFRDLSFEAERTTPEATELFRLLRAMRNAGAEAVTMEVSSHAIGFGRVAELKFAVGAFTNLTPEHLDYHPTMDAYFETKRRLFEQLDKGGSAVVNVDDPYGQRLAVEVPRVTTYGEEGMVRARTAELDRDGIRAAIETPRGELDIESRLVGSYNLVNLLGVVAIGVALELPLEAVRAGIAAAPILPGRMEPIDAGQDFPIFVDYAHTPVALEAALEAIRRVTGREVVLVFGCGGDRDPTKRRPMGRIAGRLAEIPIATSDNPRSEDPLAILREVEAGLKESGNDDYRLIPDRREAISRGVAVARPDRALLVAGKGHERVQIIGDQVRPFSDQEEIARAVEEGLGARNSG